MTNRIEDLTTIVLLLFTIVVFVFSIWVALRLFGVIPEEQGVKPVLPQVYYNNTYTACHYDGWNGCCSCGMVGYVCWVYRRDHNLTKEQFPCGCGNEVR